MNHVELMTVYDETLYTEPFVRENIVSCDGQFGRKVLVIVQENEWTEENEAFLKKILIAAHLNDHDYLIVVQAESGSMFEIIAQHTPEILFLFGLKLESDFFKSNKSDYKPFVFNNIKMVLSEPLTLIQANKDKKILLWNQCIKPLFNLD